MKIRDLMAKTTFNKVWKELRKLHNAKKSRLGYIYTWNELLSFKRIPKSDGVTIIINKRYDEIDKIEYYSVDGYENNEVCALDFSLFTSWLSRDIDKETIKKYSTEFILAHILWEMTFYGFSNKSVKKQRSTFKKRMTNIHKLMNSETCFDKDK
ncbi:MAG: DUF6557 family protein [Promethearchaeota archaeon]